MNSKELQTKLSKKMGWTQKETGELLTHYKDQVVSCLNTEATTPFLCLGDFIIKRKEQKIIVDLSTKKRSLIPPRLELNFQLATSYKHKIRTYPKK